MNERQGELVGHKAARIMEREVKALARTAARNAEDALGAGRDLGRNLPGLFADRPIDPHLVQIGKF
jgi:hypothetical protein